MEMVTVRLAAYDQNHQKIEGSELEFQAPQGELVSMSVPDGYVWPAEAAYMGFWLPDYSRMIMQMTPVDSTGLADGGLKALKIEV